MTDLHVVEARLEEAAEVLEMIHTAFGARQQLDPPSTALAETLTSVRAAIADHGGLLVRVDGVAAGALLFEADGSRLRLRRVGVDPRLQHRGVASALLGCAEEVAANQGYDTVCLTARAELPATCEFWRRRGYVETDRDDVWITFTKAMPVEVDVPTADDAHDLGARIGRLLGGGDLVLLSGDLGAGKTTLTQGIGAGLGVRGPITSPTFVISRVHPSLVGAAPLVHVDAYRLGGVAELDDLDLDTSLEGAVTVVEWGEGMAEPLAVDRLDVVIRRRHGDDADEADGRRVKITPVGARWVGVALRDAVHSVHVPGSR
ncbi:MAG TPA: tRNA (adenosine(37)-N6)-threonylcarbamoyltransferase complex ATPase subunit type 1 TsaE [Nocardioidaceae bacterium]|nr:tRNA (adenosine(37)-N6)-threonylcarbamoyltransferase complex ATPase subunit type 1 TsaE [Nocardioidaceae bacterium]